MEQRIYIITLFLLSGFTQVVAQEKISPFDGRHWGVVLEHPDADNVIVKQNIQFASISRPLRLDLYLPPSLKEGEQRMTVVILNGVGDQPGTPGLKDSPAQTSWARLLAANGFVVVTMESEINKIQQSFEALFQYLTNNSSQLQIDTGKIGVQAFSANCRETVTYLMESSPKQIKAAVLFYGSAPDGPFRDDLPVYFIIAEKDIRDNNYGRLWQNALANKSPWTIAIAPDMPHAFDFFSDSETSRRTIMSALSFWRDQLGEVPKRITPFSKEREIVAATYDNDQTRKIKLMREWMDENPESNDAYAFSAYGSALMDAQQFSEAEKYLKKAISINPGNKGNYLTMAVIYYAQGKTKEGKKNLALYEEGSTPESFTYFFIANRLFGLKKFDEALMLYQRALAFPNPHSFIFYNVGVCYAVLGDRDKAFQHLFIAADKNFGTKAKYESDENLKPLQSDERWKALMGKFPE